MVVVVLEIVMQFLNKVRLVLLRLLLVVRFLIHRFIFYYTRKFGFCQRFYSEK